MDTSMVLFIKYNSSIECISHQEICHSTPRTNMTTFCSTVLIQVLIFLSPGHCTCVENWSHQNRTQYPRSKSSPPEFFFYTGCKLFAGLDIFHFQNSLFTRVIITITKFLKCAAYSLITTSLIDSWCYF